MDHSIRKERGGCKKTLNTEVKGAYSDNQKGYSKNRMEDIFNSINIFERAESYALMGKKAVAIKDLEKILVDEPNYPEVEKKLAGLK